GDVGSVAGLVEVGDAAVVVGAGVFGFEPDRLVKVGDGAADVAPGTVGIAPVVVGGGELGIEPDRRAKVGDGAVVIPLQLVQLAPVAVGGGGLGIESDRLVKVGDGAVEIALAPVRECALVVGDGGIFRGFAAALDDASDAAIRIVPLASVPVGSARGCGRGCGRKQRSRPDKDPQYAHDPSRADGKRIIARSGRERQALLPRSRISPRRRPSSIRVVWCWLYHRVLFRYVRAVASEVGSRNRLRKFWYQTRIARFATRDTSGREDVECRTTIKPAKVEVG